MRPEAITFQDMSLVEARSAWTALARRSDNIFSTWEWADSWWRHLVGGEPDEVQLISVREAPAAIVALHRERRGGRLLLRLAGHGVADQLGPVCGPEHLPLASAALDDLIRGGAILLAERLGDDRDWEAELHGHVIYQQVAPSIDLVAEGDWETYLSQRSQKFRKQVRGRARRLQDLGVGYRLAKDPDRLSDDFEILLALHADQFGPDSGAFRGPREAFHREFAAEAQRQGWLRLWFAEIDGEAIAAWYGFRYEGVDYAYQGGRDHRWDRMSVAAAILEHSIRDAFAEGIREYRLLRGGEPYKARYATADHRVVTVVAARGLLGRPTLAAMRTLGDSARGRRWLRLEHP